MRGHRKSPFPIGTVGNILFGLILYLCLASTAAAADPPADPAGPTVYGQRGLYRSWAAMPTESFNLVIGSTLEFFQIGDFLVDGDENQRLVSRFAVSTVPITGLEINLGISIVSNNNTSFLPEQTQSVGDPFLGVRYGYALTDWFSLGGGVQVLFPSGEGFSDLVADGISTRILTCFDFRPTPEVLLTLNVGYHFDNSKRIFDHALNEAQAFSAGINPHDQVLVHIGAAWQLGPVAPFLEYGTRQAVGADDMGFSDSPNWLTVGLRAWPLGSHDFHLLAAVDIGLTGMSDLPAGKEHLPPYNVVFALAYDFGARPDPEPRVEIREVVREKEVPVKAPVAEAKPLGRIAGRVVDAQTGRSLGNARVSLEGKESATFLTDAEKGSFLSCPAEPGPVKIKVSKAGYLDETQAVLITKEPLTPVTIQLKPTTGETFGTIKGTVRAVSGKPLPARITIPARKTKIRASKKNGSFRLKLATGVLDVLISMPGYVTQRRKIKLGTGDLVILNVELYPKK